MEHGGLFLLDLAVLELPFEHFLGKEPFLHLGLFQSQTDLRLGARGLDD